MIKYILLNEDNTEVINTIFSEQELLENSIIDVKKLIKLSTDEHWDPVTHTIESSIRLSIPADSTTAI